MSVFHLEKRFGTVAVEKKYITPSQLLEAMAIQINEDLLGTEHRLLGQILLERGHITPIQIREVLTHMGLPTMGMWERPSLFQFDRHTSATGG